MEIIKLNLIPSGVNPTCHAKQYDKGRTIRFELFNGLTPYTLQSGDTVTLNLRKPDNTIIEASVTATQGNKYVDLVTTEQMCAVAGYNLGTFKIVNGETDIGTLNFIMAVERDVLADGIASQSVIEDLDALVAEAVEADLGDNYYTKDQTDAALALKANAADVYSKTQADNLLANKADSSTTYTKTQVDNSLSLKADKTEVDNDFKAVIGHGKNFINPDELITSEGSINANTGEITTEGGDYKIYGYYDITSGLSYTISKSSNALWLYQYYNDGSYCGYANSVTVGGGTSSKTFTAVGDKILLMSTKTVSEQLPQLEVGTEATAYESYHLALQSDIEVPIISTEELDTEADKVIPAINEVNTKVVRDGLTFERSYNLLDPMTIESGILGNSGGVTPSSTAYTTDFIDVNEGDNVRSSHSCAVVSFYDTSKAFISGSKSEDTKTAIAPANAKYVRASYLGYPTPETASLRCLYISEIEKPYEPYSKIKSAYLPTVEDPYPEIKFLLPRKLAIANNVNIDINFQSVVKGWNVNLSILKGVYQQKFFAYDNKIVINGGTNIDSIKVQHLANYNVNYNIHDLTLLNVPLNAGSGENKVCLFIGDSKTDANIYTQMLLDMFDNDAMNITLIGTRGNSATNRHEGRSGWSARGYCTNEYERGVVDDSPFYNPTTQKFDFNYYMTQNGYSHVDYVFICLGTNDSESNFIGYYNEMINSIKAYDNNIIIGVWTPAPFATFGGYTHFTNDAQMFPKIEDILTEYDNNTNEQNGVFVVPTHINIDTFYDFPWTDVRYNDVSLETYRKCTDQIHESYGYCHDADVIFSYIKYFATL